MDEKQLRRLIGAREGRQAVAPGLRADGWLALGLTAPMASADAAPSAAWRGRRSRRRSPTSRPSAAAAGRSRCCGGRAPTLLNPHFAVGTKDQDGSRIFYEPLAGWDADGNLVPVLAAEIPSRENGGARRRRQVGDLEAEAGRHLARRQAVHRRRRRLQLGIRHAIRRPPPTTIGSYKDVKVEKVDDYTVKVTFEKPTPFWADAFVGAARHDHSRSTCSPTTSARKSREAPTNLKPVGTGPYRFVDFKPGDMVARRDQPELPHGRTGRYFDTHRDEGRRRRGLGGARRAADRRVRLRLEHAGRGRDPAAPGEGRQGPASSSSPGGDIEHIQLNSTDPVDRGRRRALEPQDQASDCCRDPAVRQALALLVDRESVAGAHLRPHRHRHRRTSSTTRSASAPRTRSASSTSTRRTSSSTTAGWKKGADGIRDEGRQEAEVRLPDLDQRAAPEEPGDRQAGLPEGRHRHRAEVGDGVGVLLVRRRQPRHLHASSTATCRCTRRP